MGLLTDPSTGQGKFVKLLLKYYNKLCLVMYLSGIVWFCALADPSKNASTYFSENALLPGLVKSQFREDRLAIRFHEELLDEMKKYDDSIPYPYLLAKFRQIGLDTYTHNFTLVSPLNKKEKYSGKNVYGILRAARGSSTEALVLSVPFRPPVSVHPTTAPSIAIMMAFAKYANKEKYWAKDIIFLITEHEQLGIQAWLEAYHGVTCGNEDTLYHGDLRGRAGAIQAAINLELHSERIGQMDIKIEGLNGQLPNLDLFNLASKMCAKEGLYHTFKNRGPKYYRDFFKEWWNYFKNLLAMMATQATGIPNGNHGLFHRFGIQALTLEGFEDSNAKGSSKVGMMSIGRILEGTFRSLNNLLERFHQSFFFYLLPSSERYISIGLYIPSVCLIAGSLFVKACAKWLKQQTGESDDSTASPNDSAASSTANSNDTTANSNDSIANSNDSSLDKIIMVFLSAHLLGVILSNLPQYIPTVAELYDYNTNSSIFYGLLAYLILTLSMPMFVSFRNCIKGMEQLNILAMLELGTVLICISMNNFSLGLFCSILSVPLALCIGATSCSPCSFFQRLFWLFVHPMSVLSLVVLVNTYLLFSDEQPKEILTRSWDATQQSVIYGIVDSMIYGNWLYSVVTCILIPNWLCFWIVTFGNGGDSQEVSTKEKKD
ncbi:glycosylphosphatidylinositol anchor attachment 1 [Leptinotarsa decemlineata]|uniref:glycosylphosphatidylinositol anchor attachment 1 n=1 Tax=Leptinotarsa decemlineata TaxID=7539 RepID=UPI003D30A59F